MLSLRSWRAALAALSLLALVATGTSAVAGQTAPSDRAHYCRRVDAYRITTCATARLPASPLGRQLRWVLAQLAGEATTLTEAEVRNHFSAEFLTMVAAPAEVIEVFRSNMAEFGTFTLVGHPALLEFFGLYRAPPVVVPKGRHSGWFDLGGRRLFLRGVGHHSPTVVFEGGLTPDWYELQNQLAPFTRVCSWDHPNGPWSRSDPAPTPRTARDFLADLHTLLRVAGVPGPYVLAGHSNGGLYSQLSASTHPGQVAGLVLIDAVHPAYHRRRLAMLKPLLPPQVWQALRREAMTPQPRLLDPERVAIWASERQTRVALRRSRLRPMPLVVLARGRPEDPGGPFVEQDERLWRHLQRELAHLVPGGRLVIAATSGHDIQHQQPELVLDAIGDVIQAVRAETRSH